MEIHVFFVLNRDQVDVGMRNFEAEYDDRHPFAFYFLFQFSRNSLGKDDHIGQRAVVQIEQVVRLLLGPLVSGLMSRKAKNLSSSATL